MTAYVYVDGSAITGAAGTRHSAGWAAVIVDGLNVEVRHDGVEEGTSVQMELTAAIEGLRAIETGGAAALVFDCGAISAVHDRWKRSVSMEGISDYDLAETLAFQFDRVDVRMDWLVDWDEPQPQLHKLAHRVARIEARGRDPKRLKEIRHATRTHLSTCAPNRCSPACIVPVFAGLPT